MKQLQQKQLKRFIKETSYTGDKEIVVIMENIQYANNVASFFRTADGLGIDKLILTGISQKPPFGKALQKASRKKEFKVPWEFEEDTLTAISKLKAQEFNIVALEITDNCTPYFEYKFPPKTALVVGSEVYGIKNATLEKCESAVFIPMQGKGRSLNVHTASAIVLSHIVYNRFIS